jgi:Flp pilus assembly protein TadG
MSRRRINYPIRGQSGQIVVWVAVLLPLLLSVIGLAIDGAIVFGQRRELQNVADSAARAGAMQVDERAYRESSGANLVLDLGAARQVAAEYLASQAPDLGATIGAEPTRVVVRVHREISTSFLTLVGIDTVGITASSIAEVRHGITHGEP